MLTHAMMPAEDSAASTSGPSTDGATRQRHPSYDDNSYDSTDDSRQGSAPTKFKRPQILPAPPLRFSCPYRKRNPRRFNVRDHESCAGGGGAGGGRRGGE